MKQNSEKILNALLKLQERLDKIEQEVERIGRVGDDEDRFKLLSKFLLDYKKEFSDEDQSK